MDKIMQYRRKRRRPLRDPYRTHLHDAVSNNQKELVRKLLDRDAEVDATDQHDMSPLHYAVQMGNVEIVLMLLKCGASPHSTQDQAFRFTPFQHACKSSKTQILEAFLTHGSNANSIFETPGNLICPQGTSPLHMAITIGYLESIQLLLKHGADVNHVNAHQESSLHLAVRHGKEEIVTMLLDHGADATLVDREGRIALQLAVEERHPRIVELLLAREHKPDNENSRRAFKKALVETGMASNMFRCFVKRGFVLSSSEICEVAFSAVELGYFHIVEALLGYAAETGEGHLLLEARNAENGETLLHRASKRNQLDIVRLLISKKAANINVTASDGSTALHILASREDTEETIRVLLRQGPSLEARDVQGCTALHAAASKARHQNIRALLEAGASINATDDLGRTPLDIVAEGERSLPLTEPLSEFEKVVTGSMVLLRHEAIKLHAAKMHLAESNLKYLRSWSKGHYKWTNHKYLVECEAELELLDAYFANNNIAFRDVLTRNVKKVASHMREETARTTLGKTYFADKYPIYGRIIGDATEQILREYYIIKAKEAMAVICGHGLPDPCTESIVVYLRTSDLENLCIATTIQVEDGKSP